MGSTSLLSVVAKRLEGKVALITGGATTAKLFHEHGAKVVIADIKDNHSRPISPQIASFIHCDVTNESDVQNAVDAAVSEHGKLDIMFNNAGITDPYSPDILDYHQSSFERVLRANVLGVFLGTKHAARVMKRAGSGAIINSASVAAVTGGVATHAYTTLKHAVLGLTRNTAVELGPYGIRVNCVSPYVFPSSMSRGFLGREEDDLLEDIKSNLKGVSLTPEDVGRAVVYLASDEAKYVSGHNLVLDGGFTVKKNLDLIVFRH